MSIDLRRPEPSGETTGLAAKNPKVGGGKLDTVDDLVAALRPRLTELVGESDVERVIREEAAALGPVRVTTYLPILIERRVRQARRRKPEDAQRVTA